MKKHNVILYPLHEFQRACLKACFNFVAAPLAFQSLVTEASAAYGLLPSETAEQAQRLIGATVEMTDRLTKDYPKPEFNLKDVRIGQETVLVREETLIDKDFGSLLHFRRDTDRNDPKVLLVTPESGHFATLLRDTVSQLLPHHDVYVTEWKDAKHIPQAKGDFGLDDYITYVKDYIKALGPDTHVLAVCQPTVPTIAAIARLADEKDVQPLSMTLMGGPIDTRRAETQVTKLAAEKPIEWFEENLIGRVPYHYEGGGRLVYPGFVQLFSFMMMKLKNHIDAHTELFDHLCKGAHDKAEKIKSFYDEYLAVSDLPAKFYLETVKRVFMDTELARGVMRHLGKKVEPGKIRKTALFTVEGSEDDISAPGQTTAAHDLCDGIPAQRKFHYLQEGAGHYGIFSGRRWREEIAPRITGFIREISAREGVFYDRVPDAADIIVPKNHADPAARPSRPARKFGT